MKKQSQSEIQQELAGTKDRNEYFYALWKGGARQVDIAKTIGITRQRVWQIIKRAKKADKPWWEVFLFWR